MNDSVDSISRTDCKDISMMILMLCLCTAKNTSSIFEVLRKKDEFLAFVVELHSSLNGPLAAKFGFKAVRSCIDDVSLQCITLPFFSNS